MPGIPTRKDDERLLEWLDMRHAGFSSGEVGRLHNVTDSRVRVATQRVLEHDLLWSGEPEADVMGAYW